MTEQQFKKKLLIRIIASTVLFVTGVILYLYVIFQQGAFNPYTFKGHYISGFIGGITGTGIATALVNLAILKSPKFFKKRYICENDERNKQISLKSWTWSGYISVYTILVFTIFMPGEIIPYALCLMCILLVVYVVINKILQVKM